MKPTQLLVKDFSFDSMQIILENKGRKKSQIVLPIYSPINTRTTVDAFGIILKPGFSVLSDTDLHNYCRRIIVLQRKQGYHLDHVYIEYFLEWGLFPVTNWADQTDTFETEDIVSIPVAIALAQKSAKRIFIDNDLFERIISKEIIIKRGKYAFKDPSLPSLTSVTKAELNDLLWSHRKVKDRKNVALLKQELRSRCVN